MLADGFSGGEDGREGKPPPFGIGIYAPSSRGQEMFSASAAYFVKIDAAFQAGLFQNTNDVIKADPNPILLPFTGKITN